MYKRQLQRDSLLRITPTEQVLANVGNFKGGLEAVVFQNYPAGAVSYTHLDVYKRQGECPGRVELDNDTQKA